MDRVPKYHGKRVLVLGCGNELFGDDGFGPATARHIKETREVPKDVYVEDVGTGVREILFTTVLSEEKPEKIIIIDAVDDSKRPGTIFEMDLDDLPKVKVHDFSVHQFPSLNLLRELRDLCGVDVTVVACQIEQIPEAVRPGLSRPVKEAVQEAGDIIVDKFLR